MRGITLVCICFFAMTLGDVAAKWTLPVAGAAGIMIGRGLPGSLTVVGFAMLRGDGVARRLRPVRWRMSLLRGVVYSLTSAVWFVVWQSMALADTYAIGFTTPLVMTLLAIPMLGERFRWRRATATLVGFLGVLIMVRPGGDLWTPVTALLLLGCAGMALGRNMTRLLSTTETPESLALLPLLVHMPVGLLLLPLLPVHGFTWPALAAILFLGAANATGHWLNARAYALAPVAALAPYEYTPLLWGGVLGYFVFHELPAFLPPPAPRWWRGPGCIICTANRCGGAARRPPGRRCWCRRERVFMDFLTEPAPTRDVVLPIIAGISRIVAANPGPMTYHGTNTYLIDGTIVLDPGPDDAAHVQAILAATGGRIEKILVSHTHADHIGAVPALRAVSGAPTHGFHHSATAAFTPDIPLRDGDAVAGWTALHTPGHAADHLSFARADGVVFTADHVMSWSTSVVSPPQGNMSDYFASLRRLLAREDSLYLPGHGPPISETRRFVRALLDHRVMREAAILAAAAPEARAATGGLVEAIYAGIAPALRGAAERNVMAHPASPGSRPRHQRRRHLARSPPDPLLRHPLPVIQPPHHGLRPPLGLGHRHPALQAIQHAAGRQRQVERQRLGQPVPFQVLELTRTPASTPRTRRASATSEKCASNRTGDAGGVTARHKWSSASSAGGARPSSPVSSNSSRAHDPDRAEPGSARPRFRRAPPPATCRRHQRRRVRGGVVGFVHRAAGIHQAVRHEAVLGAAHPPPGGHPV